MVLRNNFPFFDARFPRLGGCPEEGNIIPRGKIIKFMLVIAFTLSRFFMVNKEEFAELELDIKERRQLPYTLTVEKVEGDKVFTRNIWGNSAIYLKHDDGNFELLNE